MISNSHARHTGVVRPERSPKQRSYDAGCGFVQFCHKHIFANPTAVSSAAGRTRKVSQHPESMMSSQRECNSFTAHYNPCYSNSSPPDDDDDDDIHLDAISLCDSLYSRRTRKTTMLPAVSEMSESCFEGLQSSVHKHVIDVPRQFRPVSWAGPVDDCLIGSSCSCCNQPASCKLKSGMYCLPETQLLNSASHIAADETCMPMSAEAPFYWELELPGTSQTSPETCQKIASPLRMGTLTFDTSNVLESVDAHAAAKKLLPNKPSCQNSGSTVDTAKAPKMGCSPSRCIICRDCQHMSNINRHQHAGLCKTPLSHEICIPTGCNCVKQRRCPTPPRMLSPSVNDDSVRVSVADI